MKPSEPGCVPGGVGRGVCAGGRPSAEGLLAELEAMRPMLADGKAAHRLPAPPRPRGPSRCVVA